MATLHLPAFRLLIQRMLRKLPWLLVAVAGALGWGVLALHRGETVSAAWLVLAAVGTYLVAFRFYSRFLADRVFGLNDRRATPAERLANGRDYVPTSATCRARSGSCSAWSWPARSRIS